MGTNPKLINFTTQDFMSEKELELASLRWDQVKDSYYKRLKKLGLLRFVSLRIWNKENISRLGFVFEYKDIHDHWMEFSYLGIYLRLQLILYLRIDSGIYLNKTLN